MARPIHDWYLAEWLEKLGKIQEDLVRDLGWNKSKASLLCNGGQRYHRDDVAAAATYLHLEPFELFLPPERAMAYRRYRASAEEVVAAAPEPAEPTRIYDVTHRRRETGKGQTKRRAAN